MSEAARLKEWFVEALPLRKALAFLGVIVAILAVIEIYHLQQTQAQRLLSKVIESTNADQELNVARELSDAIRSRRLRLELSLIDSDTGKAISLKQFSQQPKQSYYVEVFIGKKDPSRRWVPKNPLSLHALMGE